jgi:hypothetical protein
MIPATQGTEVRRIMARSQPGRSYFEKPLHKKGLVEWLKV